jgi:CheY-like chemotaxis protein
VKTILVVEDEATFRDLIKTALEQRGFRVLVAADAVQGLELATNCSVDAVVTDYHMPKMNGLQLSAALAQRPDSRHHRIPIWIMTGSANLTPEQATEAGAESIFRKPFRVRELCTALEQHFEAAARKN